VARVLASVGVGNCNRAYAIYRSNLTFVKAVRAKEISKQARHCEICRCGRIEGTARLNLDPPVSGVECFGVGQAGGTRPKRSIRFNEELTTNVRYRC